VVALPIQPTSRNTSKTTTPTTTRTFGNTIPPDDAGNTIIRDAAALYAITRM